MVKFDFTLKAYSEYLQVLIRQKYQFLTFQEYFKEQGENFICLLRHDVDRKPSNALKMAELEHSLGVKSTYYFRDKPCSWNESIIKSIADLGHEIGFHYESLCDSKGDKEKAYILFEQGLKRLRDITFVKTISMHGRPLSPYDSRDLWSDDSIRKQRFKQLGLIGEVYLDIDYADIAYINDTGRNWLSSSSNLRDKVSSQIKTDFLNKQELLNYLSSGIQSKIVFQIHPERWSGSLLEWFLQLSKDTAVNLIKLIIRVIR